METEGCDPEDEEERCEETVGRVRRRGDGLVMLRERRVRSIPSWRWSYADEMRD